MIGGAFVDPLIKGVAVWAVLATLATFVVGGFALWQTDRLGAMRVERSAAQDLADARLKRLNELQRIDGAAMAAAAKACAVEGSSAFDRGLAMGKAICASR